MKYASIIILLQAAVIPMTAATNKLRAPKRSFASSCVIQAVSELRIDPTDGVSDMRFECEMDAQDMGGVGGLVRELSGSPAQLSQLQDLINKGIIKAGESVLEHSAGLPFDDMTVFVPPGLSIAASVRNNPNRRRLAVVTGKKPILVIKVRDSNGLARVETPAVISDDIFGTYGDPVNLKSQMSACSFGQLNITAGNPPTNSAGANEVAPGVIEVNITISLNNTSTVVRNAATAAAQSKLNFTLPGPYQQVMYVLHSCIVGCGWAAYAGVNSWYSVYQGVYYKQVGVQMHEIGHNLNLAHSGGLDGATYTDHTCLMGNPLYSDDTGKMCFNPAKNWQIGWYTPRKILLDPRVGSGPWTYDMVGVANYGNNPANLPIVIKLETGTTTDFFIGFNRAVGVNAQNVQADDLVTIIQSGSNGDGYSQSFLKATLAQGGSYTFTNYANGGYNLVVSVVSINLSVNPAVARVTVSKPPPPTKSPTKIPSRAPSAKPSAKPSTKPSTTPSKTPTAVSPTL